jgi:hypothetical protein
MSACAMESRIGSTRSLILPNRQPLTSSRT